MLLIRWWHRRSAIVRRRLFSVEFPFSLTQMVSRTYGCSPSEVNLILMVRVVVVGGWVRVKYCWIFHYHTTKCVYTRRYWEKANGTKCRKMAFNNFTGHCQLNADMVILHWTMIIQPEAISQEQKQKKKRIMHLETAEEFLLSQDSRIYIAVKKIAVSCCMAGVGNVMLMYKWTSTICGNIYIFQAYLYFIQK